jgi:hypothetical protein
LDNYEDYLHDIKVLVPEGLRTVLALDTKVSARICVGDENECEFTYRAKVRAMIAKIPGWLFTSFQMT